MASLVSPVHPPGHSKVTALTMLSLIGPTMPPHHHLLTPGSRRRQTLETTVVFEGCDVQATGYFKSLFKLLWFKASQQLSTAQPLTQSIHPAPVGWGGELEKGKVCELR